MLGYSLVQDVKRVSMYTLSKITPGILITGCLHGLPFCVLQNASFFPHGRGHLLLVSRQLGRMRTMSKASSMNISILMPNSFAKHSMSPLKVQMTALKRDVGGPFTMKHCSE